MRAQRHKEEEAAVPASHVVLVAFDGVEALDVTGPASVFSKAELLRPGTYRQHGLTPQAFREGQPPGSPGSAPLRRPAPRAQ